MYAKGFFHSDAVMYLFEINGSWVNVWKPERETLGNHGKLTPIYWRTPTMELWYDNHHKRLVAKVEELTKLLQEARWHQPPEKKD